MVILGGWVFLMSEVPLYSTRALPRELKGYLAHKKHPPPWDHHRALGVKLL